MISLRHIPNKPVCNKLLELSYLPLRSIDQKLVKLNKKKIALSRGKSQGKAGPRRRREPLLASWPSVPQRVVEFQRVVDFSRGKPPESLPTGEEIFFHRGCSKFENPS